MSNILVDTHIFRKLKGESRNLLNCISSTRDTIILSNEIEDEYRARTREPTHLGYMRYKININNKCRLKHIKPSRIEAKFKRYIREIILPEHIKDHKWIKTAISEQAKYIITNDEDLTRPPFKTNEDSCKVISPYGYIQENCPSFQVNFKNE